MSFISNNEGASDMTNEEKLAVLNSMEIIETDSDGETLFYVLVDYNEENLDKLEQVVPDVEQYLADYGNPDGDKTAIEISNAAWNHAGANWFTGDAFVYKCDTADLTKIETLENEIERYKTALQTILDEGATECEGYETTIVKTAREALGISEKDYWEERGECGWCGTETNELSGPHLLDFVPGESMCRNCWEHDREMYLGSVGTDIGEFKARESE